MRPGDSKKLKNRLVLVFIAAVTVSFFVVVVMSVLAARSQKPWAASEISVSYEETAPSDFSFAQNGDWFLYDDSTKVFLGKGPESDDNPCVAVLKKGSRISILDSDRKWKHVRFTFPDGKDGEGWLDSFTVTNASTLRLQGQ